MLAMGLREILLLSVAIVLLLQGTNGKYVSEGLLSFPENDESVSNVGRPSTSTERECKKDILIVLDTSTSIGLDNFDDQVKPFLRNFVSDPELNVGPDGTQVALLLFSKYTHLKPGSPGYSKEKDKTKLVIPFNLRYDAEEFGRYIDNTDYKDVEGRSTRTDIALKIANDEVFPENSPLNNREQASDVIILITDGKPTGTKTVKEDAIGYAKKLKDKGVLIIGVGVGNNIEEAEFWGFLKEVVTPGQAIRVKFDKFQSIKNTLVKSSCKNTFSPGLTCKCPDVESAPSYLKPGETKKEITWVRPEPVCPGAEQTVRVLDFTSDPPIRSPASFDAGKHSIKYKFFMTGNREIDCSVSFEIKACDCPREDHEAAPVKPGDTEAELEYRVPVPSCLDCPSPLASQSLSVGKHSVAYKYDIAGQFNMTCQVSLEVTGALCKGSGYKPDSQECCCGVIHDKKAGHECCGQDLFDTSSHHCCEGANIRKKDEECPAMN